jgi:PTH1 family peptidyl-tRNA hydrolase
LKLIVGLGNPGAKYVNTRHNAGHRVVDRVTRILSDRKSEVRCVKSPTYMNTSGPEIKRLLDQEGVAVGDLLVVCDDAHLKLGVVRIRAAGSSGGQNGLKSIIEALGTQDFHRLRVGVGPVPAEADLAEYVLSNFNADETDKVQAAIERAAHAAVCWSDHGYEAAMNMFNERSQIDDERL